MGSGRGGGGGGASMYYDGGGVETTVLGAAPFLSLDNHTSGAQGVCPASPTKQRFSSTTLKLDTQAGETCGLTSTLTTHGKIRNRAAKKRHWVAEGGFADRSREKVGKQNTPERKKEHGERRERCGVLRKLDVVYFQKEKKQGKKKGPDGAGRNLGDTCLGNNRNDAHVWGSFTYRGNGRGIPETRIKEQAGGRRGILRGGRNWVGYEPSSSSKRPTTLRFSKLFKTIRTPPRGGHERNWSRGNGQLSNYTLGPIKKEVCPLSRNCISGGINSSLDEQKKLNPGSGREK